MTSAFTKLLAMRGISNPTGAAVGKGAKGAKEDKDGEGKEEEEVR